MSLEDQMNTAAARARAAERQRARARTTDAAERIRRANRRSTWIARIIVWIIAVIVIVGVVWFRYVLADGNWRCAWSPDPALCSQVQDADR